MGFRTCNQSAVFHHMQCNNTTPKCVFFLKNGLFPASSSLFSSFQNTVDSKQMFFVYKFLPMTGFEPQTSGIGSDRSTNWATTTSQLQNLFITSVPAKQLKITFKINSWGLVVYEQCDLIWQNLATLQQHKKLWPFRNDSNSIWQIFELSLANFICYLTNYHG